MVATVERQDGIKRVELLGSMQYRAGSNVDRFAASATLPVPPRVYDYQTDILEIRNIPSCQRGATGKGDGGDLGVELTDRATRLAPLSCNHPINVCGLPIERQHATGEVLRKDRQDCSFKVAPAATIGKQA
ncbi:hypothetical protein N184_32525 [Sinorhizobium sp. GL28]|nr:hypothetical protein N184_32525 [Sinorhizobium sp. GL28]